jgi:hypothetical protein
MAKKKTTVRRVPRSVTPRTFGDGRPAVPETATAEAVRTNGRPENGSATVAAPVRRPGFSRLNEPRVQLPLAQEYHYVPADLRRLAILAVSTFAILIILGLVIR